MNYESVSFDDVRDELEQGEKLVIVILPGYDDLKARVTDSEKVSAQFIYDVITNYPSVVKFFKEA